MHMSCFSGTWPTVALAGVRPVGPVPGRLSFPADPLMAQKWLVLSQNTPSMVGHPKVSDETRVCRSDVTIDRRR